ncbi:alpha/beta hydrolase [Methylorubrum populi]|uniref:alpha/beta hydrolase n=1 Tax=Methylorubrum populi TaxID=223967 RepID=UPI0016459382|nr:alpha/beta hydrolase [Methylorubrum populi]
MSGLLIVSDIYGFPHDRRDLGSLARRPTVHHRLADLSGQPDLSGEALHAHLFKGDGIGIAARALARAGHAGLCGVGFSAGGTALWQAIAGGLRLRALVCVSSTRLRREAAPLAIPTFILWGEADPHRPDQEWNRYVPLEAKIYAGQHHDFYRSALTDGTSPLSEDIERFLSRFETTPALQDAERRKGFSA